MGVPVIWKDADDPRAQALPHEACTHQCGFCLQVKQTPTRLARCQVEDGRHNLALYSGPPGRFRTCHAGVTDYIYSVRTNLRYVGSFFIGPWKDVQPPAYADLDPHAWEVLAEVNREDSELYEGLLEPLATVLRQSRETIRQGQSTAASGARIRAVLDWIDREYALTLTATEAAERCHWSVSRFLHAFREETGTSFSARVLAVRLSHAKRLLQTTDLPVQEVAQAVGLPTRAFFNRVFRRELGTAPRDYRRISRAGLDSP